MLECSLNVSLCELDIYITSDDALHCPSTNLSGSQILASFDPLNSLPTCRKWCGTCTKARGTLPYNGALFFRHLVYIFS